MAIPALLFVCVAGNTYANAAELSARDVTLAIFKSDTGKPVDLSQKDLSKLDLAELNFKGAVLSGANLYGTDLSGANLANVDLSGARLDRATLVRADFTNANLSHATVLRPTTVSSRAFAQTDAQGLRADVPRFSRANLTRARVIAQLDYADFRRADLTEANFSPFEKPGNAVAAVPRNQLRGANFSGAKLQRSFMTSTILVFAKFLGADLRDADFRNADLTNADLNGANVAGADFTGANLSGANLSDLKGRNSAKGLKPDVD